MKVAGKIKLLLLFQFLFLWNLSSISQCDSIKSRFALGLRQHYGFIIIHSKDIRNISNSYPLGTELDFNWHYIRKKDWDVCNCYPRIGFSITFWDFDNPEILGYGITSLFYVEPFFGIQNKFSISIRAGTGFSYLNNPYNKTENPNNQSYSTHIGFPLLLNFTFNYRINPKLYLNLAANYNHISNGGVNEPNKGINYPTASLGIDYYFFPLKLKKREKINWRELHPPEKRTDFTFFASAKQINHTEFKKYFIFGSSVNRSWQIGRINALTACLEWLVDGAKKEEIKRDKNFSGNYQIGGIMFGNEFLLGRFIFSQQIGIYFYKPYKVDDFCYQRYGLLFRVTDKFFAGISLKAHRHVADFLDFRIGVTL